MTATIQVEKTKLKRPPLDIHVLGDRVLRQSAKRVSKVDDNTRQLVRDMLQTMYSADGIGLAAPQVAVHKQLLVIDVEPDNAARPPLVLINPKIIRHSKELTVGQEGCLSIPGVFLDVVRPAAIEVAYKDEYGRPQKRQVSDLLARCIQHEMDHLGGIMFVDRVDNALALNQELQKHGFSAKDVQVIT
ncbi:Peptide deformylase [Halomicronema hongdechloris C2206]|uniref:Peptide deformylase n=1 Tax=Halomicronema hongdechloris C2206 TaxID=1641165 RepID=A0A1Z3HRT0_9CYAN|nr:peptide deformylase [Halomicronema hongdechloris]ASC72837.1 Peptide deformylase [Halomicronema hongdechloris C2206]